MDIYLATTNPDKKKEILNLFQRYSPTKEIKLFTIEDVKEMVQIKQAPRKFVFKVNETGQSFMENAVLKAKTLAKILPGKKIIAEDSGLVIERLGGRPGIFSSRYAPNDAERVRKVLAELQNFLDTTQRKAFFFTSLCYMDENRNKIYFHGKVEGFISHEPKGENGFGYDPIFCLPTLKKTFAQLTLEEKQDHSHRSRAFFKFINFIKKKND